MEELMKSLEKKDRTIWLMGDFNSLDNVKQEGYELICKSGWKHFTIRCICSVCLWC